MTSLKYFLGIIIAITLGLLIGKGSVTSFYFLRGIFSDNIDELAIVNNKKDLSEEGDSNNSADSYKSELKNNQSDQNQLNQDQSIQISENDVIKQKIEITFIGDLMFDRYIRKWTSKNSYQTIFENVKEKLQKSDLVVGNLEGPITNYESIYKDGNVLNNYTFTFDLQVAKILEDANITIVSLDNNHIFNFGREGLKQTLKNLNLAGISYFGNPDNRQILYKEINGISLAFLSYNQFVKPDLENLLQDIKIADINSDYVFVFPHWGNEYEKVPTPDQVSLAHQFIDSGADFVIGAHPHVIQQKEKYKGKYIYYSLGNFIFDQYFNEDVRCGAVVTFELDKNNIINVREEFVSLSAEKIVEFSDCVGSF